MTRIQTALCMLFAVTVVSCTSVTKPDKLKETPTSDLCEMYYFVNHPSTYKTGEDWPGKKQAIVTALNSRNAITADQWPLIDAGKAQPGMSECALKASWGNPLQIYHKVTVDGDTSQYVYGPTRLVNLVGAQVKSVHY